MKKVVFLIVFILLISGIFGFIFIRNKGKTIKYQINPEPLIQAENEETKTPGEEIKQLPDTKNTVDKPISQTENT